MKTIVYYLFLALVTLLVVMAALSLNGHFNLQKGGILPQNNFHSPTFFESLLLQGIQNLKQPVSLLILQITVILLVARITSFLFSFIGQPAVMGETVGGILLGPSLMGWVAPQWSQFLFPADSISRLQALSQMGLIVYMFIVGMEIDVNRLRSRIASALIISHSGIVFPFALGILLSVYLYQGFCPASISFLPFALFIGVAMSITAFPVLARIVKEKGLTGTLLGNISITSAAIEDVTAWSVLALVVAIAKSTSVTTSIISLLLVVLFIGVMFFVVSPLLEKYKDRLFGKNPGIFGITFIMLILMISSVITDVLGVHAVFGAFIAGLIMPAEIKFKSPVITKFEGFTTVLLLPVFFALTGLKTQFNTLNSVAMWGVFALTLLVAVAGKMVGVVAAARISKIKWRYSLALGVLMNTRGLMGLIALNIGYELGVITGVMFTILVLTCITTTFMTGPLLGIILKPEHLETESAGTEERVHHAKV